MIPPLKKLRNIDTAANAPGSPSPICPGSAEQQVWSHLHVVERIVDSVVGRGDNVEGPEAKGFSGAARARVQGWAALRRVSRTVRRAAERAECVDLLTKSAPLALREALSPAGRPATCSGAQRGLRLARWQSNCLSGRGRLIFFQAERSRAGSLSTMSPSGKCFAICKHEIDSGINLFDMTTHPPTRTVYDGAAYDLAISNDDRLLAVGGHDHVTIWNIAEPNAEPVCFEWLSGSEEPIDEVMFSPDGSYLVARRNEGHDARALAVADGTECPIDFDENRQTFSVRAADSTTHTWDGESLQPQGFVSTGLQNSGRGQFNVASILEDFGLSGDEDVCGHWDLPNGLRHAVDTDSGIFLWNLEPEDVQGRHSTDVTVILVDRDEAPSVHRYQDFLRTYR